MNNDVKKWAPTIHAARSTPVVVRQVNQGVKKLKAVLPTTENRFAQRVPNREANLSQIEPSSLQPIIFEENFHKKFYTSVKKYILQHRSFCPFLGNMCRMSLIYLDCYCGDTPNK
uniref:Uncharacterized protein n=1 Tax=Romanomermis culicivorax TaxID=13658 RepID=A0A915JS40_ROMCU